MSATKRCLAGGKDSRSVKMRFPAAEPCGASSSRRSAMVTCRTAAIASSVTKEGKVALNGDDKARLAMRMVFTLLALRRLGSVGRLAGGHRHHL